MIATLTLPIVLLGIYVVGATVGLFATDARPPARVGLALLWPLGPAAFVVTVSILLAASLVAFPPIAIVVAAVAALAWFLLA